MTQLEISLHFKRKFESRRFSTVETATEMKMVIISLNERDIDDQYAKLADWLIDWILNEELAWLCVLILRNLCLQFTVFIYLFSKINFFISWHHSWGRSRTIGLRLTINRWCHNAEVEMIRTSSSTSSVITITLSIMMAWSMLCVEKMLESTTNEFGHKFDRIFYCTRVMARTLIDKKSRRINIFVDFLMTDTMLITS